MDEDLVVQQCFMTQCKHVKVCILEIVIDFLVIMHTMQFHCLNTRVQSLNSPQSLKGMESTHSTLMHYFVGSLQDSRSGQ